MKRTPFFFIVERKEMKEEEAKRELSCLLSTRPLRLHIHSRSSSIDERLCEHILEKKKKNKRKASLSAVTFLFFLLSLVIQVCSFMLHENRLCAVAIASLLSDPPI